MDTLAVVMQQPGEVALNRLGLPPLAESELAVSVLWSGISTGTERLLWEGTMPAFPGMGYPLVPGYETVGRVTHASDGFEHRIGELVFVSGARCFGEIRGLFGGAASHLVVAEDKATPVAEHLQEDAILMALAATAHHALAISRDTPPDLIVGHGVLGRLLARLTIACGHPAPVVWEVDPQRHAGARGYSVVRPDDDARTDYRCIVDVSGNVDALDGVIARLQPRGTVVLAGFYSSRVSFNFPPAFMREARFAIAAEWQPEDLAAVISLSDSGALALDGLVTHREPAGNAGAAYKTAFEDADCLKMILDWSHLT
ncbi:MAG: chlorophyll synthesis pathway protein BchC [Pseudomonadota bacterium]